MSDKNVRIRRPERKGQPIAILLSEDLLPVWHPARVCWEAFGRLDLSGFICRAQAVEGGSGRSVLCPRMQLTLWAYGLSQGVKNARKLAERAKTDVAFMWILGGLTISHDQLSKFLRVNRDALVELAPQVPRLLLGEGVIDLNTTAQDGTKVLADCSESSLKTEETLAVHSEYVQLHLHAMEHAPPQEGVSEAARAVRRSKAKGMATKAVQAGKALEAIKQQRQKSHKAKSKQSKPRASTSDPDARIMKMPDKTFALAYNLQVAVTGGILGGPRTIIGVTVVQSSSDAGCLTPMRKLIHSQLGQAPKNMLADGLYASHECIRAAHDDNVTVYIPPRKGAKSAEKEDPKNTAIVEWKKRMATPEAREAYRARGSIVELVNAHLKGIMNLTRVPVRGLDKVLALFSLAAVAYNILAHARFFAARPTAS